MPEKTTEIAVIGTINHDVVYPYGAPVREGYGGVLYTVLALASCLSPDIAIVPVCNVGEDAWQDVLSILQSFATIRTHGLHRVRQRNNRATLRYFTPHDRQEFIELHVPPLTIDEVAPCLQCQVILINFISGIDLPLSVLHHIRKNTTGLVYVDIHTLTLGVAEDSRRIPNRPDDWQEWIKPADIVQLNLDEAGILVGKESMHENDVLDLSGVIHNLGPALFICTLGSRGSLLTWKRSEGILVDRAPAMKVRRLSGVRFTMEFEV